MMHVKNLLFLQIFLLCSPFAAHAQKPWTFLVYMARDNSLSDEGTFNIDQMKSVANENANILVFDSHKLNGVKESQKLVITNNSVQVIETLPNLDSGSPDTFLQACLWAVNDFPSDKLAIIAWDHGSGPLNRAGKQYTERGFCYDDTTNNNLTDVNILNPLAQIVKARGGKAIDLFGFDACLMADVEIIAGLAAYTGIVVASQQTVPGTGWDYSAALAWTKNPTPRELAVKIVTTYGAYYTAQQQSFTMAAINIAGWAKLNNLLNSLARQLKNILDKSSDQAAVRSLIASCSNSYFDEPTYMDLVDFSTSLLSQISALQLETLLAQKLENTLNTIINSVKSIVIANATSNDLSNAHGLSIYLPQQLLEPSYGQTYFAQNNFWSQFIADYIA